MPAHPLAEIFGFPYDNLSQKAERYRRLQLCPYNNKVPSCTKNSAKKPLGVCSIFEKDAPVITCPIRFREEWTIIEDAAQFFFPSSSQHFTSLAEIRLNDGDGSTAGNIDFVLVSLDEHGNITDFGALEVQAVYISGNISQPFEHYIQYRHADHNFSWAGMARPDFLSSSRKRLVPQLIYKGRILRTWNKRIAVAIQDRFYATLPEFPVVPPDQADVAWFIYKLEYNASDAAYRLVKDTTIYTNFQAALDSITTPPVGDIGDFLTVLQKKLEEDKSIYPPINVTLLDVSSEEERS